MKSIFDKIQEEQKGNNYDEEQKTRVDFIFKFLKDNLRDNINLNIIIAAGFGLE